MPKQNTIAYLFVQIFQAFQLPRTSRFTTYTIIPLTSEHYNIVDYLKKNLSFPYFLCSFFFFFFSTFFFLSFYFSITSLLFSYLCLCKYLMHSICPPLAASIKMLLLHGLPHCKIFIIKLK